jgi:hypothetical protein
MKIWRLQGQSELRNRPAKLLRTSGEESAKAEQGRKGRACQRRQPRQRKLKHESPLALRSRWLGHKLGIVCLRPAPAEHRWRRCGNRARLHCIVSCDEVSISQMVPPRVVSRTAAVTNIL